MLYLKKQTFILFLLVIFTGNCRYEEEWNGHPCLLTASDSVDTALVLLLALPHLILPAIVQDR